jgi:hypothetical protein
MRKDCKLALRMLLKYPGLTIARRVGRSPSRSASAQGGTTSWAVFMAPVIPLPGGHRIVTIDMQNTLTNAPEPRVRSATSSNGRRELRTIDGLGAYREDTRNVTGSIPVTP